MLSFPLENLNRDSLFKVIKEKEAQRDFKSLGKLYDGLSAYYLTTQHNDSATHYTIKSEEASLIAGDSATYYNALVTLGYISAEARNVESAKMQLEKALPYYVRHNNNEMLFHVYGNLGNVYTQLKDTLLAAYYDSLAENATQMSEDVWAEVVVYDRRAHMLMEQNKLDECILVLKDNIKRIDGASTNGKGKQYKILWRSIQLNMLAKCYYLKKNYRESISYSYKALKNDTGSMLSSHMIETNRLLVNSYISLDQKDSAVKYTNILFNNVLAKIEQLDPAKQNEISVKYEAEKKQREINDLKQKQQLQQMAAKNQRNLNIAFILIIALMVAASYYFLKNVKNERRIAAEQAMKQLILKDELHHRKELELRNSISRDLHDDIGSSLSSIKAYSEILKSNPKYPSLVDLIAENAGELIDRLEVIVWASNPQLDTYHNLVLKMKKYAEPLMKVKDINFSFDSEGISTKQQIPGQVRQNILLIFKEAINNVAKYSGAKNCRTHLYLDSDTFVMRIDDDGVGMKEEIKGTGYGLSSMKKRAAEIDGKILVESEKGIGTMITLRLSFPFAIPV